MAVPLKMLNNKLPCIFGPHQEFLCFKFQVPYPQTKLVHDKGPKKVTLRLFPGASVKVILKARHTQFLQGVGVFVKVINTKVINVILVLEKKLWYHDRPCSTLCSAKPI